MRSPIHRTPLGSQDTHNFINFARIEVSIGASWSWRYWLEICLFSLSFISDCFFWACPHSDILTWMLSVLPCLCAIRMDTIHVFGVSILIVYDRMRGYLFAMCGRGWTLLARCMRSQHVVPSSRGVCYNTPSSSRRRTCRTT